MLEIAKEDCCGCELCKQLCPNNSIEMCMDSEGFYYPEIDMEKCINCHMCEKVCYDKKIVERKFECIDGYGAFLNDTQKLKKSASGGVATALYESALKLEWIIYGVSYSNNLRGVGYVRVTKGDTLKFLKGSKYVLSQKNNIYKKVSVDLEENRKVLFIGLPCEIDALYTFLKYKKTDTKDLLTCSLICHGVTSNLIQEYYIDFLEKKFKSQVLEYTTKEKRNNWRDPYIKATFSNGKEFKIRLKDSVFGFYFKYFSRPSCYNCASKGAVADITIGYFWGPGVFKYTDWNKFGTSLLMVNSEKGRNFLNEIDSLTLFKIDVDEAINDNVSYWRPKVINNVRTKLSKTINKEEWFKAVKKNEGMRRKIARTMVKILPYPLLVATKNLYYICKEQGKSEKK